MNIEDLPKYSIFEKAVAQTMRIESLKMYRYRTGLGLREAKTMMDLAHPWDDVPPINQEEEIIIRETYKDLKNRKEIYERARKFYMQRNNLSDEPNLPAKFLVGDESGTRDGINPNYYFTSTEQVEKYVREELYDYVDGIHNFRFENGKFKFNDEDNLEWVLTIHALREYS